MQNAWRVASLNSLHGIFSDTSNKQDNSICLCYPLQDWEDLSVLISGMLNSGFVAGLLTPRPPFFSVFALWHVIAATLRLRSVLHVFFQLYSVSLLTLSRSVFTLCLRNQSAVCMSHVLENTASVRQFYRATLCVSAIFAVARCPSVYICHVCAFQTAEDIKLLSRPGSPTF